MEWRERPRTVLHGGFRMINGQTDKEVMSRREWVRFGLLLGATTAAASTGVAILTMLLGRPRSEQAALAPIRYTQFPTDQWWNDREGLAVRVTDFQEWQGATGVWRGLFQNGAYVPGTGFPVLIIRVKRDSAVFVAPTPPQSLLPTGFGLYYDDASRNIRIVALFDRSTHLCCYPGWHVVMDPPPARDYIAPTPTYEMYGLDPIYDVCHGAQWDSMVLEWGTNPRNGHDYIGVRMVRGPGFGPLPVVPLRAESDVLLGDSVTSAWYQYC